MLHRQASGAPAFGLWLAASFGFVMLYFTLAALTLLFTQKILPVLGIGHPIDSRPLQPRQELKEIRRSIVSSLIFGGYTFATFRLSEMGVVHLLWTFEPLRVLADVLFLTAWNEVHFFALHRFLHTPWLYKKVHIEHHRSVIPTPFATYSFHPIEAVLLGSVMLTLMVFRDISLGAALLYPVVSLAMNCLGHCNYQLFEKGLGASLFASSVRHRFHHSRVGGNYGFMVRILDRMAGTTLPVENRPA